MLREIIDQLEIESEQQEQLDETTDQTEDMVDEAAIDEMPLDALLNQIQLKLKGINNGN
jgi:LPS O-antigen subunit length determinant protein (WzzB/FepE family)